MYSLTTISHQAARAGSAPTGKPGSYEHCRWIVQAIMQQRRPLLSPADTDYSAMTKLVCEYTDHDGRQHYHRKGNSTSRLVRAALDELRAGRSGPTHLVLSQQTKLKAPAHKPAWELTPLEQLAARGGHQQSNHNLASAHA